MRRVGIYTNLDAQCGNAEYARDLSANLSRWYDVRCSNMLSTLSGADVIIFNWHPAVVPLNVAFLGYAKSTGSKTILLFQNSYEERMELAPDDILFQFDAVVAHEPMDSNLSVKYIPHGIPIVDSLPPAMGDVSHIRIGVAGFPFAWKRFDLVGSVARRLRDKHPSANIMVRMIAPRASIANTDDSVRTLQAQCGDMLDLYRHWLPTESVVRLLAECDLNIFWFQSHDVHDTYGQTGSARLGVAARRPMIISRHRKFRTLLPYTEDFYIADTEDEVHDMAEQVLFNMSYKTKIKVPNKVLDEMGWPRVAEQYSRLIEGLFQ